MSPTSKYARLAQMDLIRPEGLAALQRARAAVIGVGNIGGQVATHLAMLGVDLVLVDLDVVGEENLGTQGFTEQDVGLSKVEARGRFFARLNPSCRIERIQADVGRLGLGTLRDVDLIFACPDNVRARVVVNEIATRLGLPWVDAAVDGSGASLLTRVAAYQGGVDEAPCYLCAHDRRSLADALQQETGEGCPTWRWDSRTPATAPTLAMSAAGGAIAAVQVIWGLKILLGRGAEVFGREMYLDLGLDRLSAQRLRRNPQCVLDHRRFALTTLGGGVGAVTVADTFARVESALGRGVTLQLHRASLVMRLLCPGCGKERHAHRLCEAITAEEARCDCGDTMQPLASALLDHFDRRAAAPFLDRTWEQIGLPGDDVVSAVRGSREFHLLIAGGGHD